MTHHRQLVFIVHAATVVRERWRGLINSVVPPDSGEYVEIGRLDQLAKHEVRFAQASLVLLLGTQRRDDLPIIVAQEFVKAGSAGSIISVSGSPEVRAYMTRTIAGSTAVDNTDEAIRGAVRSKLVAAAA